MLWCFFLPVGFIERQASFKYHPDAPERKNGQRFSGMNNEHTDYWLLTTGYWLLATDYWLLTTNYCLLITGY
jgi:hypothetical protein